MATASASPPARESRGSLIESITNRPRNPGGTISSSKAAPGGPRQEPIDSSNHAHASPHATHHRLLLLRHEIPMLRRRAFAPSPHETCGGAPSPDDAEPVIPTRALSRSSGARIRATRWHRSENHEGPAVAPILRDASRRSSGRGDKQAVAQQDSQIRCGANMENQHVIAQERLRRHRQSRRIRAIGRTA